MSIISRIRSGDTTCELWYVSAEGLLQQGIHNGNCRLSIASLELRGELGVVHIVLEKFPEGDSMPLTHDSEIESMQGAIHKALDREVVHPIRMDPRKMKHQRCASQATRLAGAKKPHPAREGQSLDICNVQECTSND